MSSEDLTYRQALDELRAIHARLKAEDVDVDSLLDDVQRASELLDFCQRRITAVGEQLEVVLRDFDTDTGA
ncbi:MAG TPA: exodeoxyribonuclease VII small subunit [Acidimicrobiia bacterium]|nr:exodeoxyribonuclease VII small subunit [Acidimicrobiia bacterium]